MEQTENALQGEDIQRILEDLCARRYPAQLHIMGHQTVLEACFAQVIGEIVFVSLMQEIAQIQLGEVCNVSFTHEERPFLFMSAVEDFRGQSVQESAQLALSLPSLIVGVELRRTLRVPVEGEVEGLSVRVLTDDEHAWNPRLMDLSLAGMLVEFAEDDPPELTYLERVQVELAMGTERVTLRGVIRRANQRRFGIFFPEVLQGAELVPPQPLVRMVETLTKRWRQGG